MYNQNERVEVVERSIDGPLPVPAVLWIVSAREKKSWLKKNKLKLDLIN